MKNIAVLGVAALLSVALAGGREGPGPMNMDHSGHSMPMQAAAMQAMNARDLAALKPLKGRAFEVKFAQLMIDHHQMAIHMAQYALAHAQDARVQGNARQVIAAQQPEIDLMTGWLKGWGAPLPMSQTHSMTMPMNTPMPGVQGSADRWFLTEMIPHHQGAIDMARLVPARTQNAALRQLAQKIIAAQTAEISQYKAWLRDVK